MFLVERIVGLSIYMAVLLFACVLLTKTNATCKFALRCYLFCLCVMAFFYKPYVTADLYRIHETMNFFADMDFLYFWKNFALESSVPIARLLFWFIGKTGVNSLISVVSAFFCYYFIFYIITKSQKIFSIQKKNVSYVLFFVMTTSIYISVIGGVRMMLSLSMLAYSYFRGSVEKKFRFIDVVTYTLSLFIHTMSLVVIALCVVVMIFDSRKPFLRRFFLSVLIGLLALFIFMNFDAPMDELLSKFREFVLGDMYSDKWEYLMGGLIILLLIVVIRNFWNMRKQSEYICLKSYNTAMILFLVVAVCFCFEFSIFYRFCGHLAVIFSIPTIMITLQNSNGRTSGFIKGLSLKELLLILGCLIAIISCARGSLSSIKFFEL